MLSPTASNAPARNDTPPAARHVPVGGGAAGSGGRHCGFWSLAPRARKRGGACWWLLVAVGADCMADCVTDRAVALPMVAPADATMRK